MAGLPLGKLIMAGGSLNLIGDRIRDSWSPPSLQKETQFRDSLAAFLRSAHATAHIETEYPDGGTRADVYFRERLFGLIPHEIFVELKLNLRSKSEYNRLVGQIMDLDPSRRQVLVVLVGDTDQRFVHRLHSTFRSKISVNQVRILEICPQRPMQLESR